MLPRKRLDLAWRDLAAGLAALARRRPSPRALAQIRARFGPEPLCTLSVRSGFDLLLRTLALPAGSRVLVSAVTIPDMPRILRDHGLVPVPVDLDPDTLAPRLDRAAAAVDPDTRALLVAHLFGTRIRMAPLAAFARRHGLMLWEDCAQAFAGDGYRGDPRSDVAFFSFGLIKMSTALGGAVLRVRDPELRQRLRAAHAAYPVQTRRAYARQLARAALLRALAGRRRYGGLVRALGPDHDRRITALSRGFAGSGFYTRLRRQPSAALLELLGRRLAQASPGRLRARVDLGRSVARELASAVPGRAAPRHVYWVFPVCVPRPDALCAALWAQRLDATRGLSSLAVVEPPPGAAEPTAARALMQQLVYLPVYPGLRRSERRRLEEAVRAALPRAHRRAA